MHLKLRDFLKFSVFALLLPMTARALPSDNLHLRSLNPKSAPWGAGVFYHITQVDGGVGVRADLGFQLSRSIGEAKFASALLHVQSDSVLFAFSHMTKPLFASPARWTLGVDLRAPFSYLGEGQIFFPMGNFEPYVAFRLQSTGFSVEGGDGNLYDRGASSRFWLASAGAGAGYSVHPDLRLAVSYTYRTAFGVTEFKDPGVFHASMQWLWGDRAAQ